MTVPRAHVERRVYSPAPQRQQARRGAHAAAREAHLGELKRRLDERARGARRHARRRSPRAAGS